MRALVVATARGGRPCIVPTSSASHAPGARRSARCPLRAAAACDRRRRRAASAPDRARGARDPTSSTAPGRARRRAPTIARSSPTSASPISTATGSPISSSADAAANRVTWIRQAPRGHVHRDDAGRGRRRRRTRSAVDLDRDGDLDVARRQPRRAVPEQRQIGSVIVLENDGRQAFTKRVLVEQGGARGRRARRRSRRRRRSGPRGGAVRLRRGRDAVDGEPGRLAVREHIAAELSGPINAEIADRDGDGDLDIVTLVSQEWEEVYAFVNDGRGRFTPRRIFGASNEDFGSSWITARRSRQGRRRRRRLQQRRRVRLRAAERAGLERRAVAREPRSA